MPHFVVERTFAQPFTDRDLSDVGERMTPCLELYGVRWLRSNMSEDRLRMVCEYEARDAQSVRKVQHESEAKFDRVWLSTVIEN